MFSFLVLFSPIFIVNLWHGYLLASRKDDGKPHTISEHGAANARLLVTHRALHISASVSLITYALTFLRERGFFVAMAFLIVGAVCDVIEVLALKLDVKFGPDLWDAHQLSAWGMAFCYMAFGIAIAHAAQLPTLVVNGVWLVFLAMLLISIQQKFYKFWIYQMSYFVMLSVLIIFSHVQMI
jgi:hypothetical protein